MENELPFGIKYTKIINFISIAAFIFIGLMLAAIAVPSFITAVQETGNKANPIIGMLVGLFAFSIALVPAILLVILNRALSQLKKRARIYQIILSCLGFLSVPIGTILHGAVLYFMFFDEKTKEAFGVK